MENMYASPNHSRLQRREDRAAAQTGGIAEKRCAATQNTADYIEKTLDARPLAKVLTSMLGIGIRTEPTLLDSWAGDDAVGG
jgi:hypothetical protein